MARSPRRRQIILAASLLIWLCPEAWAQLGEAETATAPSGLVTSLYYDYPGTVGLDVGLRVDRFDFGLQAYMNLLSASAGFMGGALRSRYFLVNEPSWGLFGSAGLGLTLVAAHVGGIIPNGSLGLGGEYRLPWGILLGAEAMVNWPVLPSPLLQLRVGKVW